MNLYDVSGAAAWNNKADHGIIVYRPDKAKNHVYVKVSKSKNHTLMGTPGIVRMEYLGQYKYIGMGDGTFTESPPAQERPKIPMPPF